MSVTSSLPTALFLFYVLLFTPFNAWRGFRRVKSGTALPPKLTRFRRTVLYLIAITVFAVVAAATNQIPIPLRVSILDLILIVVVAGVWGFFGARGVWRRPSPQLERNRVLYAPTTPQELRWGLLAGLSAGIGEEIIYRCVLFELIFRFSSSLVLALVVCVVVFAVSHLAQGQAAALVVGYMGLMFHVLFLTTHTLAVPIGIHAIYDMVIFSAWYLKGKRRSLEQAKAQAVVQGA